VDKIRVIIADDHELVRDGLRRILEAEEDIECVGVAENGLNATKLAQELLPDVALVDVTMPDMDGIEATKAIKQVSPNTAILVVSAYDYEHFVLACIEAGASGYVLKADMPARGLVRAVHMVHEGVSVYDREPSKLMRKLASAKGKRVGGPSELGPRELEVLMLAAKGMSNKQIAIKLGISDQTVGTHFANMFRKLKVQSRMEAVLSAFRKGWIVDW
jgi:DNA-binding NarL/FixJ family response regulator